MTTATPFALRQYREPHKIKVIRDYDPDFNWVVYRCEHDHLRVIRRQRRNPRVMALENDSPHLWRHDPDDVRSLAKIERGEA